MQGIARHNFRGQPQFISGWHPDVIAWDAAVVAGGGVASTPDYKSSLSTLLYAGAGGWYDKTDHLNIFADPNINSNDRAARTDFKARRVGTFNGSNTKTNNQGFAGDSSTGYFDTGFNPTVGSNFFLQDLMLFGFYTRTDRTTFGTSTCSMSQGSTGSGTFGCFAYIMDSGNIGNFDMNGSGAGGTAMTHTKGLWLPSRTSSTACAVRYNGGAFGSYTDTSHAIVNGNFLVNALNLSGGPFDFCGDQQSMCIIGGGWSTTEQDAFYAAFQAFATRQGFNV